MLCMQVKYCFLHNGVKINVLNLRFILVIRTMPAKRILILTNRVPYPLHDGGNMATDAMVRGYASQGWDVYLLSMNTSRHHLGKDVLAGLYKDIYRFQTVDINNEVTPAQVLQNLLFSSQPNHATRFTKPVFQQAILQAIDSFQPDVVQVESVFLSGYLPAIREATIALITLRLHNIEWQVWQRVAAAEKNLFKKWYISNLSARIRNYEKKVWQQYDVLIPITATDAQVVDEHAKHPQVITIPFGINTDTQVQQADEKWCGYHIGAMDWLPNQDAIHWFAKEVWQTVRAQNPDFEFYFAGRNMPDVFNAYNSNGLHCMGEVADAQSFISDKKILIVPLRSGGGIRVKILEAMAAGKVVISTSVGMQGIDAIDGQHYLMANTPQAFADAISIMLQDKIAAQAIAGHAKELVAASYNAPFLAGKLSGTLTALMNSR
ncbi:hypothetical protein CAP35_10315 [Chitinophagaceae bacterium IBVUCB1]|nr:hypothetical protein CAP35_10315 [Chitinophagaceae bacterium IBVUCB1]